MPEVTKKCGVCRKVLPQASFKKSKRSKDGLQSVCLKCRTKQSEYYQKNKTSIKERQQSLRTNYFSANEILSDEYFTKTIKKCSICGLEKTGDQYSRDNYRKDGLSHRCRKCDTAQTNSWVENNRTRSNEIKRRWEKKNPQKSKLSKENWESRNPKKVKSRKLNYQNRRRENPIERLMDSFKTSLKQATFSKGKKISKSSVFDACGYTVNQLRDHLEKQFDDQMTWENHGEYWEIDHRWPQSLFDIQEIGDADFLKCWSLENLQPLTKTINNKKRARLIYQFIKDLTFYDEMISKYEKSLEQVL